MALPWANDIKQFIREETSRLICEHVDPKMALLMPSYDGICVQTLNRHLVALGKNVPEVVALEESNTVAKNIYVTNFQFHDICIMNHKRFVDQYAGTYEFDAAWLDLMTPPKPDVLVSLAEFVQGFSRDRMVLAVTLCSRFSGPQRRYGVMLNGRDVVLGAMSANQILPLVREDLLSRFGAAYDVEVLWDTVYQSPGHQEMLHYVFKIDRRDAVLQAA